MHTLNLVKIYESFPKRLSGETSNQPVHIVQKLCMLVYLLIQKLIEVLYTAQVLRLLCTIVVCIYALLKQVSKNGTQIISYMSC